MRTTIAIALIVATAGCVVEPQLATVEANLCTVQDCPEGVSTEELVARQAAADANRLVIACTTSGSWPGPFVVCCSLVDVEGSWGRTICADNSGFWWY